MQLICIVSKTFNRHKRTCKHRCNTYMQRICIVSTISNTHIHACHAYMQHICMVSKAFKHTHIHTYFETYCAASLFRCFTHLHCSLSLSLSLSLSIYTDTCIHEHYTTAYVYAYICIYTYRYICTHTLNMKLVHAVEFVEETTYKHLKL
jgi:hypothetical protein